MLTHGGISTKLFFEEPAELPNLESLPSEQLTFKTVPTQYFEWFSWPSFMSLPDDPHQNKEQLHSDSLDKTASAPTTTSSADVHIYNDNDNDIITSNSNMALPMAIATVVGSFSEVQNIHGKAVPSASQDLIYETRNNELRSPAAPSSRKSGWVYKKPTAVFWSMLISWRLRWLSFEMEENAKCLVFTFYDNIPYHLGAKVVNVVKLDAKLCKLSKVRQVLNRHIVVELCHPMQKPTILFEFKPNISIAEEGKETNEWVKIIQLAMERIIRA